MIKPTIGRVVWYWPHGLSELGQPLAATIAFVHTDRSINIGYLHSDGRPGTACHVELCQEGDSRPSAGAFCEWMPYQVGQARAQNAAA